MRISDDKRYAVEMIKTATWQGTTFRAGTKPALKGLVIKALLAEKPDSVEVQKVI